MRAALGVAGCLGMMLMRGCVKTGGSSSSGAEGAEPTTALAETAQAPTGTFALDPQATDPDGDELSFSWTLQDGPTDLFLAGEPSGSGVTEISVPTNGVYRFEVEVSDGVYTITDEIVVEVNDPGAFGYEGRLLIGDTAEPGVDTQLIWDKTGEVALRTATATTGDFEFMELVGLPGDFLVEVADSSPAVAP